MANVNIKEVNGGEATTIGDDDGFEKDDGVTSTWVKFSTLRALLGGQIASRNNLLVNGGFTFAQRQAPGTLTTITIDKYSADRWRISRENADLQYQRNDALGETGLTSQYYGLWKKITNAGKLVVYQILEGANSVPLRSKTVTFSAYMKASSAKTIRMAVLELQTAGAIDTIPGTFVTAYGANSTDPTFGANVAIITGAESKSVTTSWTAFSVTVTVPATSKNIIVAFWSDSQFSANDTLSVAQAGLYVASYALPWVATPKLQDLQACQRHYFKTFLIDTAPAQNIGANTGEWSQPATAAGAATERGPKLIYPVPMFATPTLTTYSILAASAEFYDATALAVCTAASSVNPSPSGVQLQCTGAAGTAVGNSLRVHLTAEAEL